MDNRWAVAAGEIRRRWSWKVAVGGGQAARCEEMLAEAEYGQTEDDRGKKMTESGGKRYLRCSARTRASEK